MADFKLDEKDLFFNLFEKLKVQETSDSFDQSDLTEILTQYISHVGAEQFPYRQIADEKGVTLKDGVVTTSKEIRESHQKFCESGWNRLGLPEEIEGIPVPESITTTCNAILCGANVAYSMFPELTVAALRVIVAIGSDHQKKRFIPKMIEGPFGGTMCLTEAGAGSDVGALKTRATPIKDDLYNIKGVKCFISSGDNDLYENMIHLVLARTPDGEEGTKGISLFIVPKYRVDENGNIGEANDVVCTKIEEKMGIHSSPTCELTFGANGGCEGYLIGNKFEGMKNMFMMMNEARLFVALHGSGPALVAYELTKKYASERVQFGKEIINLPDVKRMILKMRALSRGMIALCQYLAHLIDIDHKEPGKYQGEIGLLIPVAKSYCTDEGYQLMVDAIQVHGGYGFCSEYGIEQFARDCKIASIYEGTNGIQSIDLVTRKILRDKGEALKAYLEKSAKFIQENPLSEFPEDVKLLGQSIKDCGEVATSLAQIFQKSPELGLEKTYDFQNYFSTIVVSLQLYESAIIAKKKIEEGASGDQLKYYQTKIEDFKIYSDHYLRKNIGLKEVLRTEYSLSALEL